MSVMNVLSTFLLFLHKLITLKYLQVHFTTGILFELVGKRKAPDGNQRLIARARDEVRTRDIHLGKVVICRR